jgi:hypothetical protein
VKQVAAAIQRAGRLRLQGGVRSPRRWLGPLATAGILGGASLGILVAGGVLPPAALTAFSPVLVAAFLWLGQEARIIAVVLTIATPISVPLLGKDGGTATTFLIFLAVAVTFVDVALGRLRLTFQAAEVGIYVLVLVGFASLVTKPPESLLNAFRFYYIFLSGLMLFLLVVKSAPREADERCAYVGRLVDVLIVIATSQVIIGLLVYFIPSTGGLFAFFLPSNEEELAARVTDESIRRLATLISGPEPTGEMLAVLAPLVLHKYFQGAGAVYLWTYLAMAGAEVLTATRSTSVLFALGSLAVVYAHSARIRSSRVLRLLLAAGAGGFLILLVRPDFADALLARFAGTRLATESVGELGTSLNRGTVWAEGVTRLQDLPPFGHGFARVLRDDGTVAQFHSLYLTSLYQLGWLGAPVLLALFGLTLVRLWKVARLAHEPALRSLMFCTFVALLVFLVNEVKYEFNRHPPYFHFCWVFLAVAYLISTWKPWRAGMPERRAVSERCGRPGLQGG